MKIIRISDSRRKMQKFLVKHLDFTIVLFITRDDFLIELIKIIESPWDTFFNVTIEPSLVVFLYNSLYIVFVPWSP